MPGSYMRPTLSTICPAQIACDGNYIHPKRIRAGAIMCAKCESAAERRNKMVPPRGTKVYRREKDE